MATIGTFTKNENGAGFTGAVKTLTLNVKAKFVPSEGDSERGPDFRIFAGATEFGAAWKKTARETQREYLSVKLDDPSFPARSTPAWSKPRTAAATTSSGLAATATEASLPEAPPRAGLLYAHARRLQGTRRSVSRSNLRSGFRLRFSRQSG